MTRERRMFTQCLATEIPLLYDLAYDVFDIPFECNQLLRLARYHGLSRVRRVLDLGCGTGHHAIFLASCGLSVTAVDRDEHMLRRARCLARESRKALTAIDFVSSDMCGMRISGGFDLSICLGASFNSLVRDFEARGLFEAVGAAMNPGGVFLLELHDPDTTYGENSTAHWTVHRPNVEVRGLFTMARRRSGIYRWDIRVEAEFNTGRRCRALLRTSARPWRRKDIARLCRLTGVLQLVGWRRVANHGEAPRIIAVLTRVRRLVAQLPRRLTAK